MCRLINWCYSQALLPYPHPNHPSSNGKTHLSSGATEMNPELRGDWETGRKQVGTSPFLEALDLAGWSPEQPCLAPQLSLLGAEVRLEAPMVFASPNCLMILSAWRGEMPHRQCKLLIPFPQDNTPSCWHWQVTRVPWGWQTYKETTRSQVPLEDCTCTGLCDFCVVQEELELRKINTLPAFRCIH